MQQEIAAAAAAAHTGGDAAGAAAEAAEAAGAEAGGEDPADASGLKDEGGDMVGVLLHVEVRRGAHHSSRLIVFGRPQRALFCRFFHTCSALLISSLTALHANVAKILVFRALVPIFTSEAHFSQAATLEAAQLAAKAKASEAQAFLDSLEAPDGKATASLVAGAAMSAVAAVASVAEGAVAAVAAAVEEASIMAGGEDGAKEETSKMAERIRELRDKASGII